MIKSTKWHSIVPALLQQQMKMFRFFRQKNDFSNEMTILTFNVVKQKKDLLDFNLLLGFLDSSIPIRQHSGSDYNNVLQGFSKHI